MAVKRKGKKPGRRHGKRRGKVVKTTLHSVQTRVSNPRKRREEFALVAKASGRKRGRRLLRYTGTKFDNHAKPALFTSLGQVRSVATGLRRKFGRVLRNYSLYAEPRTRKKS